ncbi:MAG TPA: hypothetical protein VHM90_21930 [Phycisphaerae bacterium]|nr:hypothetical protein [Phycisphaerae bacterium]
MSDVQIAFLAEGKLYVKRGAQAVQLIESPFAQGVLDRAAQNIERHGWRSKSMDNPYNAFIWNRGPREADTRLVRITALSRPPQGDAGQLLYALDTGAVGGLFTYDFAAGTENRIFHRQEFKAHDVACHPAKQVMVMSTQLEDGTASIALMQPGSRKLHALTEGDSLDQAPAWVPTPDDPQREVLVYHSAGLSRDQRGHIQGVGPHAIHRLDVDQGKFKTLLEDAAWDYLVPRVRLENGKEVLYFIRRPYKAAGHDFNPWRIPLDMVLFPFRMLRAIFAFLNAFSMFFTQKPLTTAGGPKNQKVEMRFLELHGKWIDTQKALRAAEKGKPAALVPATWELMSMTEDGTLKSLATSVLAFDMAPDGTLVYSNGSEIFRLPPGGPAERVCAHRMIQQVMVFC